MKRNAISNLALKLKREARRKQLNATCVHCNGDILHQLSKAADDWSGYEPPASTIFECPHCEEELEFKLEWKTMLCGAIPVGQAPSAQGRRQHHTASRSMDLPWKPKK